VKKEKLSVDKIMRARPFLKWAGGKTQLLPELLAQIPATWKPELDLYAEPFVGAGALYFALAPRNARLGDANPELVACWKALQSDAPRVVARLADLEKQYRERPEMFYYGMRDVTCNEFDLHEKAARLIFLNKTCFNGLYRVNRKGKFNVPWGANPNVTICDASNLLRCGELLSLGDTQVKCTDFARSGPFPRGTLVYLDPPYLPRSRSANFTAFTPQKFHLDDHARLAKYAGRLADEGCHVLVSESDDAAVADLFRDAGFECTVLPARRKINSQGYSRGPVSEHIFFRNRGH